MHPIKLYLSTASLAFIVGCGDGGSDPPPTGNSIPAAAENAFLTGTTSPTAVSPTIASTTANSTTANSAGMLATTPVAPPEVDPLAQPANIPPPPSTANTSNGRDLQISGDRDYRAATLSIGGATPIGIDPYAQGGSGAILSIGGHTPIGIDPYARGGNGAVVQVGGDGANMAWCRPTRHPSFLVAQYFVNVPNGRVAHRTGVQDYATGQQGFDAWQYTDVIGGAFSAVRYMNAPPPGRWWAPIVQVYRQVNHQWQFYYAYYLKVNYSYDWCS